MSDITFAELSQATSDPVLRACLEQLALPEDFAVNEFFMKLLDAASVAAAQKNETLEAGKKILSYPIAVNGAIARAATGETFFPRTSTVVSRIVVDLDLATPVIG